MSSILSDEDIARLLKEKKPLPDDYQARIQIRPKRGHKERDLQSQINCSVCDGIMGKAMSIQIP